MSIIAYVGLPGSGKSYDVVANQIMPALQSGRRVVTNIPLNKDAVREVTHKGEIVALPYEKVEQEPHVLDEYATPGCLLVLDEVWRLWPAGWKAHQIPQTYKSLLAEHRHRVDEEGRSMQIVLVTQDLAQIAAFARQLVEQTFYHTKLAHLGASSSFRIDVFHGAVTGAIPPINKRIREILGKFKPETFVLYKSHTMSNSKASGADEKALDERGQLWRKPVIWLTAAATLIGVVWGFGTLSGLLTGYTDGGDASVASPSAVRAASPSTTRRFAQPITAPMATMQPGPSRSAVPYRLVGTIENHDDAGASVALITDGKRYTTIDLSHCKPDGGAGGYRCEYEGASVSVFGSTM